MKVDRRWIISTVFLVAGFTGCANTGQVVNRSLPPDDPVMGLLSKGITQLDININALSKRMNEVQQISKGTDPRLQELQALDLSGWQLHRQQWVLQRDHLALARDSLQRAAGQPEQKKQLFNRWREHQQQYVSALEDLHQQRRELENQHVEVETRLIEQRLRYE